jgi:small multidrug resistance family-3 protein
MLKLLQPIYPILFLIVATTLESFGDAIVRKAIYEPHQAAVRLGLFGAGGVLLLGYGTALNLAPVEFSRVVGLYIATLFVVWQVVNFMVFRSLPTPPVLAGGALIILGGLIVTFWPAT